jgi:hypothetical protein
MKLNKVMKPPVSQNYVIEVNRVPTTFSGNSVLPTGSAYSKINLIGEIICSLDLGVP